MVAGILILVATAIGAPHQQSLYEEYMIAKLKASKAKLRNSEKKTGRLTFKEFEVKFGKRYKLGAERFGREAIYNENLKFIDGFNSDHRNTVHLDVGPFADKKHGEFEKYVTDSYSTQTDHWGTVPHLGTVLDDEFGPFQETLDWVEAGAVSPVQQQGTCGSCWSFSAVGALEGTFFLETSYLIELSKQYLLDCNRKQFRCHGGFMSPAFEYVRENGICSEHSYPYKCQSTNYACTSSTCSAGLKDCRMAIPPKAIVGYFSVQKKSRRALQIAVTRGPVAVALNAGTTVFQHYSGGVVDDPYCGFALNHAVLAVGFGEEEGKAYWLVKNSWGDGWGVDGYIKIGRGLYPDYGGECGILLKGSFPVLGFRGKESQKNIFL